MKERERVMDDRKRRKRAFLIKIAAVLALLLLWELVARIIGSALVFPTPEETIVRLLRLLLTAEFWSAVGATVARGAVGFCISFVAGVIVGTAAGASEVVRAGVSPLLTVLRATPVMSIILLALIWFRSDLVPVFVAFLMVFPIICGNVTEGVRNVDRRLLGMAGVYRVRRSRVVIGIYLPSALPYLMAALASAVGITWKVIIAAEVLSQPLHAVGSGLQLAKYRLDTAAVFAWTFVAIALTALSERGIEWLNARIPWRRGFNGG